MKLETSEEQVARGVAAIEREWPASVSEPYPNMPAVTLRPGEKPVELDDLVRTVLAAAGPPAPPLPAEVEEMRKKLDGPHEWGYRCVIEGTFISDPAPFDAASLLSRWPGGQAPEPTNE